MGRRTGKSALNKGPTNEAKAKVEEQVEQSVRDCPSPTGSLRSQDSLISDGDSLLPEQGQIQFQSDANYERKFFIMKNGSLTGKVYPLLHPRSGERALYLFDEHGNPHELVRVDQGKRSMFYGDSVVKDGSIQLFLPVHPLFLTIDCLRTKAKDKFVTLAELLNNHQFPALVELTRSRKLIDSLKLAADFEQMEDEQRFRFNEERMLEWLGVRFKIVKQSMATSGADENENTPEYCLGILADYLSEEVEQLLSDRLGIEASRSKGAPSKKRPLEVAKGDKKDTTPARKKVAKGLAEASKGSMSLTAFFSSPTTQSSAKQRE